MSGRSTQNNTGKQAAKDFFVAGGTLAPSACCYLTRKADDALLEGLIAGEMCYVLNTRQMGKSSLMVRTAVRMRELGGHSILLDLTSIGQNLTADQWYLGMLCQTGELTGLQNDIVDYWVDNAHIGPLQRFIHAIRMLLNFWPSGPVVIFVDEIDAVKSLKFSTDEFFAAIRECHNRKATDPVYQRLTFCLIGVAVPTDLIRDVNATPFNVGRRIVLTDFTFEETLPFLSGLKHLHENTARAVLRRVLYWTGGQPYLTQRLCVEAVRDSSVSDAKDIDRICSRLYLERDVRDSDPNLSFAQNRILNGGQDRCAMLAAYRRSLHAGLPYYPTDTLCEAMLLSGLVTIEHGNLIVRNRIYRKAFDEEWIKSQLPGSEVQRQRAEYRRGLWRGAASVGAIAFVVFSLFFANLKNQKRAVNAEKVSSTVQEFNRDLAYDAQFQLLHDRVDLVGREQALNILRQTSTSGTGADLRRFEWFYLNRLAQQEVRSIRVAGEPVECIAFSPTNGLLAASGGGAVRFWSANNWELAGEVNPQFRGERTHTVAFFPDGVTCAFPGRYRSIQMWNTALGTEAGQIGDVGDHSKDINTIAISHSGKLICAAGRQGFAQMWLRNGALHSRIPRSGNLPQRGIWCSAFMNHDREIAFGCDDGIIRIFNVADGSLVRHIHAHSSYVYALAVSPDGALLASGSGDGTTALFDTQTGELKRRAEGHTSYVYTVAFSSDGRYLTSGGWDHLAQVWDLKMGNRIHTIKSDGMVWASAFDPSNSVLAVGTSDGQIRLVDITLPPIGASLENSTPFPLDVKFTLDCGHVASLGNDGNAGYWDIAKKKRALTIAGNPNFRGGHVATDGNRAVAIRGANWVVTETATGRIVTARPLRVPADSVCMLSGNGKILAEIGKSCTIWDVNSGTILRIFSLREGSKGGALNHDGGEIAIYGEHLAPYLINVQTGSVSATSAEKATLSRLIFSNDGKKFVAIGRTVTLYNAQTCEPELDIVDPFTTITCVALSRDNSRLVSAGADHLLKVWDTATARIVLELPVDSWRVVSVDISDDNRRIAASLDGQGLRVWDAADYRDHMH